MKHLDKLKSTYLRLPDKIKNIVSLVPPSILLGRFYCEHSEFLRRSENWLGVELAEYQERSLLDIVEFAANTVPYYRDLFNELGIPSRLQSIEDFKKIPYLTKEIVLREKDRMISDIIPISSRYKVTTGGTSGTPLEFWMSSEAYAKEWAFVHDFCFRYGIKNTDKKLGFRGVAFPRADEGVYSQINPIYRELQISPFHITDENIFALKNKILNFKPRYIHGYPSSVFQFARIASEQGWSELLQLKGVFLISESVFDFQEDLIANAFKCPVFSHYGQTERLIFAGSTPGNSGYFCDPRYGYTEAFEGELVGTGFLNKAMPMLRYRTGDSVKLDADIKLDLKGFAAFPRIIEIEGRWLQEMVVGKSNTLISVTALNMHSDLFRNVFRFQYIQSERGKLVLAVIPKVGYKSHIDNERIYSAFIDKVGQELDLEIIQVGEINLTNRGKHKFLIQKIDLAGFGLHF